MTTRVLVLVGTKKGGFILESDEGRAAWTLRGPFCEVWPIYHMAYDPATATIYAGGGDNWYGPAVWTSHDLGATWTHSSEGISYDDGGPHITKVWHVAPAHGALYAGVDPAGLFRSDDGGVSWTHVTGLRAHPSCPSWGPGLGGLCLHSIVSHPVDPQRMWVAISAVGTFQTVDGGASWEARNKGLRADYMPEPYPEVGFCVHKLLMASGQPETLYQQNHCGVYRSADGGVSWDEVTAGLPSDFGFPLAVHPHDPRTLYAIPLTPRGRFMPDAQGAVWRSRDAGDSWERLTTGLPESNAYLGVLREAMAVDTLDRPGIYFGTSSGEVFGSADEGDSWTSLVSHLPPVWSVETAIIKA